MIDTTDPILNELADHFVELHGVGGIELEQWETAYKFVKHFYHTEEMVQIIVRDKKFDCPCKGCLTTRTIAPSGYCENGIGVK